jgi:hypothetical protein
MAAPPPGRKSCARPGGAPNALFSWIERFSLTAVTVVEGHR